MEELLDNVARLNRMIRLRTTHDASTILQYAGEFLQGATAVA